MGDQIDAAREVARFNLFELTNNTGARTTVHVVNAHIRPEQFQADYRSPNRNLHPNPIPNANANSLYLPISPQADLVLNLECQYPELMALPREGQA